jgi:pantothenate synthetase
MDLIDKIPMLKKEVARTTHPEYVEIIDGKTLLPLEEGAVGALPVICMAVWAEEVRLIDNVLVP